MKTIRQNCFETNSSSTHSVTIVRKGDHEESKNNPLVVDGVLYPSELVCTPTYRKIDYGEEGHSLLAVTKDQKAALFVDHMLSRVEYDFMLPATSKIMAIVKEELIRLCGYTDVKDDGGSRFSAYSEDGNCYIDSILPDHIDDEEFTYEYGEEEFRPAVVKHILEVILDNDVYVSDEDVPY